MFHLPIFTTKSCLISLMLFLGSMSTHALALNSSLSFSVIKTAESSGSLEAMMVDGGSWFTVRNLVHVAVLVRHPKGDFLWDSGIGTKYRDQMSVFNFYEKQLLSIENVHPAYEQLTQNNYPVKALMAVIPSHMHWDHASGLEDFSGIPIWLQQVGLDEAKIGQPPAFIQSQYDSTALSWHILKMANKPYKGFNKSLDIYGDGSAILVDLSGHTRGQLGLFLNLDNKKSYFFVGDTVWSVIGIEKNKSRPAIVQWLMRVDTDYDENAKLIEKIHKLSIAQPELMIVPAHDERQLKKLPVYPNFSP